MVLRTILYLSFKIMSVLKHINLMFLICQTIGVTNINSIPTIAMSHGTAGSVIASLAVYLFLGIPLMYMELIIGQFTGRDCVEVWNIRPCLSYTGYILVLWQVIILVYNHVFVSFIVHYFLISFENPIPYYKCGPWTTRNCNLLSTNYTVNEDCMKLGSPAKYCDFLHTTFPEYQYWRYYLLGLGAKMRYNLYVAWRVCLASGLVCIFIYLSCFKRKQSMKWVVTCLPVYSILGFVPIMLGSMMQKGLVANFEDALDLDFSDFTKRFRLANIILQVVYNLGIGSGIGLNFGSTSSFRFNCYSNGVIAVVISAIFSTLITCTTAMMTCPYTYQYNTAPGAFIKLKLSLVFEKVPRLLSQYDKRLLWIILVYSCYATTALCTNVLLFYNLLEILFSRYKVISNYPGLTSLIAVICLFLVTIPLLSNYGILFALAFKRYVTLVSTFVAMIESLVFIICYGIHKFSEDVHFMLGIQPSFYIKAAWLSSVGLLGYAFFGEILYCYKTYSVNSIKVDILGGYMLLIVCGMILICIIMKVLVAICRKSFMKIVSLHPSWGPKSQILQRSRGMFSAQAMTKEYMYRQYHLQAGIVTRQKNSNKRNVNQLEEPRYSS